MPLSEPPPLYSRHILPNYQGPQFAPANVPQMSLPSHAPPPPQPSEGSGLLGEVLGNGLQLASLLRLMKQQPQPIEWNGPRSTPDQYLPPVQVPQFTPDQLQQIHAGSGVEGSPGLLRQLWGGLFG